MIAADLWSHKPKEQIPFHIFMIDFRERNAGKPGFLFRFVGKAAKEGAP